MGAIDTFLEGGGSQNKKNLKCKIIMILCYFHI